MISTVVYLGTIEKVKAFVDSVSKLECDVDIISGRYIIDAKSIMGIFSLDLSKNVTVRIHADGPRAEEALKTIRQFETT